MQLDNCNYKRRLESLCRDLQAAGINVSYNGAVQDTWTINNAIWPKVPAGELVANEVRTFRADEVVQAFNVPKCIWPDCGHDTNRVGYSNKCDGVGCPVPVGEPMYPHVMPTEEARDFENLPPLEKAQRILKNALDLTDPNTEALKAVAKVQDRLSEIVKHKGEWLILPADYLSHHNDWIKAVEYAMQLTARNERDNSYWRKQRDTLIRIGQLCGLIPPPPTGDYVPPDIAALTLDTFINNFRLGVHMGDTYGVVQHVNPDKNAPPARPGEVTKYTPRRFVLTPLVASLIEALEAAIVAAPAKA